MSIHHGYWLTVFCPHDTFGLGAEESWPGKMGWEVSLNFLLELYTVGMISSLNSGNNRASEPSGSDPGITIRIILCMIPHTNTRTCGVGTASGSPLLQY